MTSIPAAPSPASGPAPAAGAADARARRVRRLLAGAVLVGSLALSGCQFGTGDPTSGGSGTAADGSSTGHSAPASDGGGAASAEATQPTGGDDAGGTVIDEDAAAAGVDLTAVGEPVATAEVPATVAGDPDATMTVALYGLQRRNGTVVATYSFTVHSDTETDPAWLYDYLGDQGWRPYAVDSVNLNKHGVIGSGEAQTRYQGTKFRPGQTFYAFAIFAAPPEDVTTMDVLLVDGAPLAMGVEIR